MQLALFLLAAASLCAQPYDLLLKGGHVIDPRAHLDAVRDVGIRAGRIAAVAGGIPDSQARKVVNVAGLYVYARSEKRRHRGRRSNLHRPVPTFNDAASDAPPKDALSRYVQEGFDLVAFSGGKALLGPQCSGLLLERKDLIEAALPAISPTEGIGRGMKVSKEEMVGLPAAVERYLKWTTIMSSRN